MAGTYVLTVLHRDNNSVPEIVTAESAAAAMSLIPELLAKYPECHRIKVEAGPPSFSRSIAPGRPSATRTAPAPKDSGGRYLPRFCSNAASTSWQV